ncbi:MAG: hypothetical protein SGPRY_001182 [Prymnesium sp.]
MGLHVEDSSVPVGRRVEDPELVRYQLALERESSASLARLSSRFAEIERREASRFHSSLEHAVAQAQARVTEGARTVVDKQVRSSLRAHIENSPAAKQMVHDVCIRLEQKVEEKASVTVARIAGDSGVSGAIEKRCLARVDEKMQGLYLWTAVAPLLSAAAAFYISRNYK